MLSGTFSCINSIATYRVEMNYLKVYCNLIRKAENRTPPDGYTEKHHIFPVSIYGKNNRVVVLTSREHYIAHALLEKICIVRYGVHHYKTHKMTNAHMRMKNNKRYYNSYLYEKCRNRFSEIITEKNKGRVHSIETREKMGNISEDVRILRQNIGKEVGNKFVELKVGIHNFTKEERVEVAKMGGNKCKELGKGIHSRTEDEKSKDGKMGGKKTYELKIGAFSIPKEEKLKIIQKVNSQRWMCLETGYISNAGALSTYQKKRDIDTSKRKRIS